MGVSVVVNQPIPEGKSGQHALDCMQSFIEGLGSVKSGNFVVDCETYQAVTAATGIQRTVNVLHNTEQPASCFSILDNGNCLTADILFAQMLNKLQHAYQQRKNVRVECKGQRYVLGDFVIKVGSVSLGQNQNFRGILVEVEYKPCLIASECTALLREMVLGLVTNTEENLAYTSKISSADSFYKPSDTIQQYLDHFNNFRQMAPVVPR